MLRSFHSKVSATKCKKLTSVVNFGEFYFTVGAKERCLLISMKISLCRIMGPAKRVENLSPGSSFMTKLTSG